MAADCGRGVCAKVLFLCAYATCRHRLCGARERRRRCGRCGMRRRRRGGRRGGTGGAWPGGAWPGGANCWRERLTVVRVGGRLARRAAWSRGAARPTVDDPDEYASGLPVSCPGLVVRKLNQLHSTAARSGAAVQNCPTAAGGPARTQLVTADTLWPGTPDALLCGGTGSYH